FSDSDLSHWASWAVWGPARRSGAGLGGRRGRPLDRAPGPPSEGGSAPPDRWTAVGARGCTDAADPLFPLPQPRRDRRCCPWIRRRGWGRRFGPLLRTRGLRPQPPRGYVRGGRRGVLGHGLSSPESLVRRRGPLLRSDASDMLPPRAPSTRSRTPS